MNEPKIKGSVCQNSGDTKRTEEYLDTRDTRKPGDGGWIHGRGNVPTPSPSTSPRRQGFPAGVHAEEFGRQNRACTTSDGNKSEHTFNPNKLMCSISTLRK